MESTASSRRFDLLKIFGLGLLAGVLSFAWSIIWQGGLFSLAGDFNAQQIPFAMAGNDAVKAGNWGWASFLDLGSSFIGGQSFYTLGNPSFWISVLFPSSWFMYVVGWLYALKYAVATLTAYIYIRQYVRNFRTASVGALLYAFSGYMATDLLFYHFHDVVALFPLLLFAFDAMMMRGRKGLLIFAVCLNAVVNYFFIVGEVIFLVAYYVIRYLVPGFSASIRKLPRILVESALGGLLGAALLVPSFLFTVKNPRVGMDYMGSNSGVFSFERYLYILKGLLFPGEVMSHQSAVIRSNFSSCNAYLPLVGMVLVIAFLSLHKKHWVSRMLKFSLVMAVVPFFNASFSFFAGLYCRWYYMPILIMSLASAIMLERWDVERKTADHNAYEAIRRAEEHRRKKEEEELANGPATIAEAAALAASAPKREETIFDMVEVVIPDPEGKPKRKATESERAITKGFIIWGLILLGFVSFLVFVPWSKSDPTKIFSWWQFAIWASISGLGTLITWLILTKKRKKRLFTLTLAVFAFSVLTTGGLVLAYQIVHGEDAKHIYDRLMTSAKIEYNTPEYRFQGRDNLETLAHSYPATGNFCSTVSGSIFRFYEGLGLSRDVKSPDAPDGLYALVSARYSTSRKEREDAEPIQVVHGDYYTYYVYEDESIPPIGFTQDTYMTLSDFKLTDTSTRAIRMLKTLVVSDEDEQKVAGVLRKYNEALDGAPKKDGIEEIGRSHLAESSTNVEQDSWRFASTITSAADKYAFFSIPNDEGWSCMVNGREVEILDSNGFMAVPVKTGENRVVFTYTVPGLRLGILLSMAAAVLTLAYLFMEWIAGFIRRYMFRRSVGVLPLDAESRRKSRFAQRSEEDMRKMEEAILGNVDKVLGPEKPSVIVPVLPPDAEAYVENSRGTGDGYPAEGAYAPDGAGVVPEGAYAPDGAGVVPEGAYAADGAGTVPEGAYAPDGAGVVPEGAYAADGAGTVPDGAYAPDGAMAGLMSGYAVGGMEEAVKDALSLDGKGTAMEDGPVQDGVGIAVDGGLAPDGTATDRNDGFAPNGTGTAVEGGFAPDGTGTAVEGGFAPDGSGKDAALDNGALPPWLAAALRERAGVFSSAASEGASKASETTESAEGDHLPDALKGEKG